MFYDLCKHMGLTGHHISWFFKEVDHLNRPLLASEESLVHSGKYLDHSADNIVVHDHTNWVPNDPENWILIYTKRLDVVAQALDEVWAAHTKEYVASGALPYTDKVFEPITVDMWAVLGKCMHREKWDSDLTDLYLNNVWKQSDVLYYESFSKQTPEYMSSYLGLAMPCNEPNTEPYTWDTQKSPRRPEDYILNYDETYKFCWEKLKK